MRLAITLVLLYALMGATGAAAATAEAREVARINNCPPKKVEVFQQTLGSQAKTIYRVECNLPKTKDESAAPTADAILVLCNGSLCELMRPVGQDNK